MPHECGLIYEAGVSTCHVKIAELVSYDTPYLTEVLGINFDAKEDMGHTSHNLA